MTYTVSFVFEEHQEYGTNGWRPEKFPGFDPLEGMAVPHDVLEHFEDDDGKMHGEFQALGAAIYVREDYWAHYMPYSNPSPAYHVSGDFERILTDAMLNGDERVAHCPAHNIDNDYAEGMIEEAVTWGINSFRKEREYEIEESGIDVTDLEIESIKNWMRRGYDRAVRRFDSLERHQLLMLFVSIEEKVKLITQHAEIGDTMTVFVNEKTARHSIMRKSVWEDDYEDEMETA